ncbi:hypothetical protein QE364_000797 [Nocardioides zeae]|uniref:Uncharacterized protein n=1 Tax=Nocardioides zeae TaxID=1457234 RepID=A0ACC6IEC3_9ACTN|nr:hypothetical protein [Nocardioides zeae]MDR6209105.1 hypothetical protein [Nocardioides zeae]
MTLIWATRGRNWGFRFLRDGGLADPLPAYERAFAGAPSGPTTYRSGATLAVRIMDPLGRKDAAGRVIPHEFVVSSPLAERVRSIGDAQEQIWPLVAGEYDDVWDREV